MQIKKRLTKTDIFFLIPFFLILFFLEKTGSFFTILFFHDTLLPITCEHACVVAPECIWFRVCRTVSNENVMFVYQYRRLLASLFGAFFFNSFPNKPLILHVCITSLLKTLWGKEKLHVTSNFSFSQSVFYPFREPLFISVKFEILSANSFSFEKSKICRLGKV